MTRRSQPTLKPAGGEDHEHLEPTVKLNVAHRTLRHVQRFRLVVLSDGDASRSWESSADRCTVGTHPSNDLVVDHPSVSRFHCEIWVDDQGAHLRDVGSLNGTLVDGTPVVEAWLRNGSTIHLGAAAMRFQLAAEPSPQPLSAGSSFGQLVGSSAALRTVFAVLERVVNTDSTVLLEGETGTGKELAAEALHLESHRSEGPLVVVDCGAAPPALLESQLFGHERGAFTGAHARSLGAFEEASGGTIFLDEIGELPLELQPKLLRVLEKRTISRVGSNAQIPIDVRVVAATNRSVRAEVNQGTWRSDLYYRLAVVKVRMPPLRECLEDMPTLVEHLLRGLGAAPEDVQRMTAEGFIANLQRAAWPGNVRELRNYLERCLVLDHTGPVPEATRPGPPAAVNIALSYEKARRTALQTFERDYLNAQLAHHGGNVSRAADASDIGRVYFYRLLRRNGIRPR